MFFLCCLVLMIMLLVVCDVKYFIRSFFSVLFSQLFQSGCTLSDTTAFYSIGDFQDCDVNFKTIRLARIIRELDFARYEYYCRTGVFSRTRELKIHSLQGNTFVVHYTAIPLFVPYKITCKVVYWDNRSLFIEHEVVTLKDGQVRALIVSRQYALSDSGASTQLLLQGLTGADKRLDCPKYIKKWLDSIKISSDSLRSESK